MAPCPFCREVVSLGLENTPTRIDGVIGAVWWVRCFSCRADGPRGESKGEAWSKWEQRPIEVGEYELGYQEGQKDAYEMAEDEDGPVGETGG